MARSRSYEPDLLDALQDPQEAAEYLSAALEDGDPKAFLLALRDVAEAMGGMGRPSRAADLNRESLYRMLSGRGNPRLKSLDALLHAMGLRLAVEVEPGRQASTGQARREGA